MVPVCSVDAVGTPVEQGQYQVRFDWGADGARAIGVGADMVVLVDVLGTASFLVESIAGVDGVLVAGSLRNGAAVARWALERQARKGDRFTVSIIAVGEPRADGSLRFALEDLLGAGAIIDALAEVGIDYCSPEAAAAAAAFTGLRGAIGHLIGASTSGRGVAATSGRAPIDLAVDVGASDEVVILREFSAGSQRSSR